MKNSEFRSDHKINCSADRNFWLQSFNKICNLPQLSITNSGTYPRPPSPVFVIKWLQRTFSRYPFQLSKGAFINCIDFDFFHVFDFNEQRDNQYITQLIFLIPNMLLSFYLIIVRIWDFRRKDIGTKAACKNVDEIDCSALWLSSFCHPTIFVGEKIFEIVFINHFFFLSLCLIDSIWEGDLNEGIDDDVMNQCFSTGVPWDLSKCAAKLFLDLTFSILLWKMRRFWLQLVK